MKLRISLLATLAMVISLTAHAQDDITVFNNLSDDMQNELINCGVDEDEFDRLMSLDYYSFDQDFDGGWREIDYKDQCQLAAAHVIKSYTAFNAYTDITQRSSLIWHTGQLLAGSGQYEEAISYFKQTYKSGDDHADWNLYVGGTLAFLRKDKAKLITLRDQLAAMTVPEDVKTARRKFLKDNPNITMPEGFIDAPLNLSVMNDLIACFDKPYSQAYGNCDKP